MSTLFSFLKYTIVIALIAFLYQWYLSTATTIDVTYGPAISSLYSLVVGAILGVSIAVSLILILAKSLFGIIWNGVRSVFGLLRPFLRLSGFVVMGLLVVYGLFISFGVVI